MDLRTTLAALLGIGLGLLLIAVPDAVLTAYAAGRVPHDRTGEYGTDRGGSPRLQRLVQVVGVVVLGGGLYFGWQALGL